MASGMTQAPWSAFGIEARFEGVSMTLGNTTLAVTFVPCSSAANVWVRVTTPALDTAYALSPATGCTAVRLVTLTIRPQPPASMCGITARQHRKAEVKL